jgi:hypothetical protein
MLQDHTHHSNTGVIVFVNKQGPDPLVFEALGHS